MFQRIVPSTTTFGVHVDFRGCNIDYVQSISFTDTNSKDPLNHHICANTIPDSTQTIQARGVSKKKARLKYCMSSLWRIYISPWSNSWLEATGKKNNINRTPSFGQHKPQVRMNFVTHLPMVTSLNLDIFFSDIGYLSLQDPVLLRNGRYLRSFVDPFPPRSAGSAGHVGKLGASRPHR